MCILLVLQSYSCKHNHHNHHNHAHSPLITSPITHTHIHTLTHTHITLPCYPSTSTPKHTPNTLTEGRGLGGCCSAVLFRRARVRQASCNTLPTGCRPPWPPPCCPHPRAAFVCASPRPLIRPHGSPRLAPAAYQRPPTRPAAARAFAVRGLPRCSTARRPRAPAVLRDISPGTSYQAVRWVFRRYTPLAGSICTSDSLGASGGASPAVARAGRSSPPFGPLRARSLPPRRPAPAASVLPTFRSRAPSAPWSVFQDGTRSPPYNTSTPTPPIPTTPLTSHTNIPASAGCDLIIATATAAATAAALRPRALPPFRAFSRRSRASFHPSLAVLLRYRPTRVFCLRWVAPPFAERSRARLLLPAAACTYMMHSRVRGRPPLWPAVPRVPRPPAAHACASPRARPLSLAATPGIRVRFCSSAY